VTAFDKTDVAELPKSARTAIEQALGRLDRAATFNDVEGVVGASKELVETVAKAVVDALGGSYGSDIDMPKLAKQALEVLGLHPAGLQDRHSLRRLSSAQVSMVTALAELRNTDGTGHGRAAPSNLDAAHATLARETAISWCQWTLAAARRVLRGRVALDEVLSDIAGARVFHRGEIPTFLEEHRLPELGEENQRKLGLAAGRRWSSGGTFLMLEDLIEPLAAGKAEYPAAFAEGVLEGLVLDHNGYVRTTRRNVFLAVQIGMRLPADRGGRVFDELADRVDDALLSQAFDEEPQAEALDELRGLAPDLEDHPAIQAALIRIAQRIELLGDVAAEWDDDEDYEDETT